MRWTVSCELGCKPFGNHMFLAESAFQEEFQVFATSMASSSTTHFPSNRILGGGSGRVFHFCVASHFRHLTTIVEGACDEKNVSNQLRPIAESPEVQQLAEGYEGQKPEKDGKFGSIGRFCRRENLSDFTGKTWVIQTNGLFSEPYGMLKPSPR